MAGRAGSGADRGSATGSAKAPKEKNERKITLPMPRIQKRTNNNTLLSAEGAPL
jgi:hypothetical protein